MYYKCIDFLLYIKDTSRCPQYLIQQSIVQTCLSIVQQTFLCPQLLCNNENYRIDNKIGSQAQKVKREKGKIEKSGSSSYLKVKKAFSVSPEQAVAIAITKVVIPNVECIGTRLARKEAVADSQHKSNRKLKKPTMN